MFGLPNNSPNLRNKREDRVRCKWLEPKGCKYYCRAVLQSDGTCDDDDECVCSGEHLEKHVCSANVSSEMAHTLCAGYCQAQLKQSGDCDYDTQDCVCTGETLKLKHLSCLTPWVCRFTCNIRGYQTGKCEGPNEWDCICVGKEDENELE